MSVTPTAWARCFRRWRTSAWPACCSDRPSGTHEQLAALHSTRLDMLLEKMLDTTVRAVVYEAAGTVDPELLAVGAARVRYWCERSLIPYVLLESDPADHEAWTEAAAGAGPPRADGRRPNGVAQSSGPTRSNRSARIRAVAPQIRSSPTT